MNYFKSFLLTAFALFTLAACNTDDLRDDVDNLKGRVESLEAQINLLNDNMTAIKRLLEGGQTITEITQTNGTYTLKLSGGETVTLTQGSAGEIKYPEISVNDEGQWVVNGEVLTQNGVPVQAVGTPGNDGITPKFRLTDDGSYWQVSYDNGTSWQDVLDESGNKVSAVNNGSSGGSSSDTFFESAGIDESGDFFVIQLKGQNESISIPIVKDLLCEIIEPAEGMNKGYWEIGAGEIVSTTVKVKGDNVIVTAPAGWLATISEANENNEATLTITAPTKATALNTRATADNSSDVTVQVNKGANWAVDKIQVKLSIIRDYYTLFEEGEDINIGGITINKNTYQDANIAVLDGTEPALDSYFSTTMSKPVILFLSGNQEFTVTGTKAISNDLIIMARYENEKPTFKNTAANGTLRPRKGSVYLLNLHIAMEGNTASAGFITNNDLTIENNCTNLVIDNCYFSGVQKPLYCDNKTADIYGINNISLQNNKIQLTAATVLLQLGTATNLASYKNFDFINNLMYSANAVNGQMMNCTTATDAKGEIVGNISNNTIINIIGANVYFRYQTGTSLNMNKNIFYMADAGKTSYLYSFLYENPQVPSIDVTDNIVYSPENSKWSYYHSNSKVKIIPDGEKNQMTLHENSPITSFDYANGVFTLTDEMMTGGYGASIN